LLEVERLDAKPDFQARNRFLPGGPDRRRSFGLPTVFIQP
jgi:hypothetical protein